MAKPIKVTILGDASGLERTFKQVEGMADGLDGSFGKLGATLVGAFAGLQVGAFLKDSVGAASNLNEAISKTNVVFGQAADGVRKWASTASTSMGLSERAALTAVGTLGNLFRSMEIGTPRAAEMSQGMVQLASDLGSFNDVPIEEALEALRSGLVGETEPLKRFGINLNAAAIEAKAMELGLARTKGELDAGAKAQAAYALIMEQTSLAQGDFARTSDGLANTQRQVGARIDDLKVKLGAEFLPLVLAGANAFGDHLLPALEGAIPVIGEMVRTLAGAGTAVFEFTQPVHGLIALLGTFALSAATTGAAIGKIVEYAGSAKESFAKLLLSAGTLGGGLGLLGAALGGVLALGFLKYSADAAMARKDQEELTETLRVAQDPTQGLTDRLHGLTESLTAVSDETKGADEGVKNMDAAFAQAKEAADGTEESFNRLGITAEELNRVAMDGGEAFNNAASQALNLASGTSDMALATQGATEAQRTFIESLFAAQAAGQITDVQLADMLGTVGRVGDAWDATREKQQASIESDIQKAVSLGQVTQAWVDDQFAASGAGTEFGRVTEVGKALEQQLIAQGVATDGSKAALDGAAGAASGAERANFLLIDSVKALEEAQRVEADTSRNQEAALDKARDAIHGVRESAEKNTPTLDGMTDAGRRNRDAFRDAEDGAARYVGAIAAAGGTAEAQQGALHGLADEAYGAAIQAGYGADEAQRLADRIRGIPTYTNVDIVTTYTTIHQQAGGNAGINAAAAGASGVSGGYTLVGERGPERLYVPKGSSVVPNHLGGGGGDTEINVYVETNADPDEIARAIAWEMRTTGR